MSAAQPDLFDALRAPPVIIRCEPNGKVLQGDPDVSFALPHKRMAWHVAEIEIHRHDNGLWMWSTSFNCDGSGSAYKVGPKWGKFAQTKADALFYAVSEIEAKLERHGAPTATLIMNWARGLAA